MSSSSNLKNRADENSQPSSSLNSNQSLLPGHFGDFGKKEYWDRFFESRQSRNQDKSSSTDKRQKDKQKEEEEEDSTFEWYGNYEVM